MEKYAVNKDTHRVQKHNFIHSVMPNSFIHLQLVTLTNSQVCTIFLIFFFFFYVAIGDICTTTVTVYCILEMEKKHLLCHVSFDFGVT